MIWFLPFLLAAVPVVVLFYATVFTINSGYKRIQTRFGKNTKILDPGVGMKLPIIDGFAGREWHPPIREHTAHRNHTKWIIDFPMVEVQHNPPSRDYLTKDSQKITVDLNFYSKIVDIEKAILCSDLWQRLELAVDVAVVAICHYSTEATIWNNLRDDIYVNKDLGKFCELYGIQFVRSEVQHVQPTQAILTSRTEMADKRRAHEFAMTQQTDKAAADAQRIRYEQETGQRMHEKDLAVQNAATLLKQQRAKDEAAHTLLTLEHKARQHEATANHQRMEWKLATEGVEADARNRLAMAKAEAEAVSLKAGAATKAIYEHVKALPHKEQADVLNTYHMTNALRDSTSIHTVNFLAPGAYHPQMAPGMWSSPYPYGGIQPGMYSQPVASPSTDKKAN